MNYWVRRRFLAFLAYGEVPRFGIWPIQYDGWVKSRVRDEFHLKRGLYDESAFTHGSAGTI